MKRKIYVASHGDLSKGIVDSAKLICGEILFPIEAYTLLPGMSAYDFEEKLFKEITGNSDTEYIIITDLFGASVCNSMYSLLELDNVKIFSGMNLNMLLSICIEYPEELSTKDIQKIMKCQ